MRTRLTDEQRGSLGCRLRTLRQARRLTQVQLAARAGVSRVSLADLERGKVINPSLEMLHRLADALESPIEVLVMG